MIIKSSTKLIEKIQIFFAAYSFSLPHQRDGWRKITLIEKNETKRKILKKQKKILY